MGLNLWYIFASALFVTTHAIRFDRGPQLFVDPSSQILNNEQKYETKEVVLYLTPSQVKALEAGGAVVKPRTNEAEPGFRADIPTQNEEETQQTIDQEQNIPNIDTIDEQEQKQISELEEIFRILNKQIEDEQKKQQGDNDEVRPVIEEDQDQQEIAQEEQQEADQATPQEEEQVQEEEQQEEEQQEQEEQEEQEGEQEEEDQDDDEEEQQEEEEQEQQQEQEDDEEEEAEPETETEAEGEEEEEVVEIPRRVPTRFRPSFKQPEIKTPTPTPVKKEKRVRNQPVGQSKKSKLRPRQKKAKKAEKKKNKSKQDAETPTKKTKTTKTERPQDSVQEEKRAQPVDVEQTQEKLTALLTPLLSSDKIVQSISQQRGKLVKSELELQAALRQLKQSPKYNDQKFAIEVEKLKENLEKQNILSRAEVIAKTTPSLIKEDIKKHRLVQAVNRPAVLSAPYTVKASQPYTVPLHYVRPVSVPVVKSANLEIQKPVTVEVEERVPVHVAKNVYYKLNKPYAVERIVPVGKKEIATSLPIRKPERLTILRHVWEH